MSRNGKFLRWAVAALCVLGLQLTAVRGHAANEKMEGPQGVSAEGQAAEKDLLAEDGAWYGDEDRHEIRDPLEPWNRAVFSFNDRLYYWVLKPVKTVYSEAVPKDIRSAFGNFFANLATPVRLVNTVLQGRFGDAGVELSRFVVNSTLGVYGFGDAAADCFDLSPQRADFGQTMGVYGIGEGLYLYWPVFGPSNLRESAGLVAGISLNAIPTSELDTAIVLSARGVERVNQMSLDPDFYEDMKKNSLDPYVAIRQAYHDYRSAFVKAGKQK